ncbi:MAG: hypothetical protein AAB371_01680 [Patescibacteria group bacterium]
MSKTLTIQEPLKVKIGQEPMVLFPLKEWEEVKEMLEEIEDARCFNYLIKKIKGNKKINLKELSKKYNLV